MAKNVKQRVVCSSDGSKNTSPHRYRSAVACTRVSSWIALPGLFHFSRGMNIVEHDDTFWRNFGSKHIKVFQRRRVAVIGIDQRKINDVSCTAARQEALSRCCPAPVLYFVSSAKLNNSSAMLANASDPSKVVTCVVADRPDTMNLCLVMCRVQ